MNYDFNLQFDKISLLPKYQNQYGGGNDMSFSKLYFNDNPEAFGPGGGAYNDNDGKGSYDLIPQYSVDESWGQGWTAAVHAITGPGTGIRTILISGRRRLGVPIRIMRTFFRPA